MKEMKAPKHFLSEMLNKIIVYSLDRSDEDKEHTSTLIHTLCTEGLVTGENTMQASVKVPYTGSVIKVALHGINLCTKFVFN